MHNEKGQEVDESNDNGLYQKMFCSGEMDHFGSENGACPRNSETTLRFSSKNLQNERG